MMNSTRQRKRKVAIVGAGAVGATFAYALAQSGLADQIALIDKNEELARGQVLDLAHGQPFFPTVSIEVGNPGDYGDADLIVLTAGAAQKPGESSVLTVSTPLEGEFGLHHISLSVHSMVSSNGVTKIVERKLPENEQKSLEKSADTLKEALQQLGTSS